MSPHESREGTVTGRAEHAAPQELPGAAGGASLSPGQEATKVCEVLLKREGGARAFLWEGVGGPVHLVRGSHAVGRGEGQGQVALGRQGPRNLVAPTPGDIISSTTPLLNPHWKPAPPLAQVGWKASRASEPHLPVARIPPEHLRHLRLKRWNLRSHLRAPTRIH